MTMPGTKPSQRVHVPAIPSGQLPDPGGADAVTQAHRRQLQVAQAYQAYRNSIPAGVDPGELKDAAGGFASSDAAKQLQPALNAVKAESDAANQAVVDAVKSAVVGDDQHGAATRIWARLRDRLDQAKTVSDKIAVAQNLISHSDGLELATLREELPFYLQTAAQQSGVKLPPGVTDWIEPALAKRIPAAADAAAKASTLAKQHAVLQANHTKLVRSMERDTAVPHLMDPAAYGN